MSNTKSITLTQKIRKEINETLINNPNTLYSVKKFIEIIENTILVSLEYSRIHIRIVVKGEIQSICRMSDSVKVYTTPNLTEYYVRVL